MGGRILVHKTTVGFPLLKEERSEPVRIRFSMSRRSRRSRPKRARYGDDEDADTFTASLEKKMKQQKRAPPPRAKVATSETKGAKGAKRVKRANGANGFDGGLRTDWTETNATGAKDPEFEAKDAAAAKRCCGCC